MWAASPTRKTRPTRYCLRNLGADGETEHLQIGAGDLGPQRDRDVGQTSRLPDQFDAPAPRGNRPGTRRTRGEKPVPKTQRCPASSCAIKIVPGRGCCR